MQARAVLVPSDLSRCQAPAGLKLLPSTAAARCSCCLSGASKEFSTCRKEQQEGPWKQVSAGPGTLFSHFPT